MIDIDPLDLVDPVRYAQHGYPHAAWTRLHFGVDPLPVALATAAAEAHTLGLLDSVDLHGILQLQPLNSVLSAAGRPTASSAGYGPQ